MSKKIIIDVEVFENLVKMLNSSQEDQDLALENIKNINPDLLYHKLFVKSLLFKRRLKYVCFFDLDLDWTDLTMLEIMKEVKNDSSPNKEHFHKITHLINKHHYLQMEYHTKNNFLNKK